MKNMSKKKMFKIRSKRLWQRKKMKIRSFIKSCAKIYKTKAAKVALLGVCSTMLLVSSGASFAKYYSENGFGDGASIAELGDGVIYYNYESFLQGWEQ